MPGNDETSGGDGRQLVDHTYRDFSQYISSGGELIKHKKSDANFPAKLQVLLSDEKNADVITWMVSSSRLVLIVVLLHGPCCTVLYSAIYVFVRLFALLSLLSFLSIYIRFDCSLSTCMSYPTLASRPSLENLG